jgi:hypothetical protein
MSQLHRSHVRTAAAAAVLAAAVLATPSFALTFSGRVLKGQEERPVAGQPVQIHVIRGQEELPGGSERTDAQGRFRFTGLKSEPGLSYFVATEYQGAFYTEGPLQATGDVIQHDVLVYDVGSEISNVKVVNQHVIVERQADGLHVTEILIFQNSGKTAFLGVGPDHAENAGMRIGLPASVKAFQVGVGGDDATTALKGRDLASTRPIPPGQRPFSFTYHVPLSGRIDFSHRFYYPTETFVVMLDDPRLKVESRQLEYAGSREQGGKKYEMYTGANFGVGQEATIRIGGASLWSNPAIYPWLAAPFLIVAVLYLARQRGRRVQAVAAASRDIESAHPVLPAAPPAAERAAPPSAPPAAAGGPRSAPGAAGGGEDPFAQVYLYLISALDQASARGELSGDACTLVRRNLKRKLEVVLSDGSAAPRR